VAEQVLFCSAALRALSNPASRTIIQKKMMFSFGFCFATQIFYIVFNSGTPVFCVFLSKNDI
ncbi:MAG: hypothetical protein IKA32_00110, partial [Lentisphaeria bacterium]|nr:hypothetical protein [Lentisphaeria bacterium]